MVKKRSVDAAGRYNPRSLKGRLLMSPIQAGGLAAAFKVLANDIRLRLSHVLVRAAVNVHYRVMDLCVQSSLDQVSCLTEESRRRERA